MACGPSGCQAVRPPGVRHCGRRRTAPRCASIWAARLRLEASRRSRSATRSKCRSTAPIAWDRSEEHTSELQSLAYLVCRLLLEKKKKDTSIYIDLQHSGPLELTQLS